MTCTFFGHSDCPLDVKTKLKECIEKLILEHSVDLFYVGDKGNFDKYVAEILSELIKLYPYIRYHVVLSYVPVKINESAEYFNTIVADGAESVPRKFAISHRNRWMIRKSDYVITYVKHSFGGAAGFAEIAKKQGEICINISDENIII